MTLTGPALHERPRAMVLGLAALMLAPTACTWIDDDQHASAETVGGSAPAPTAPATTPASESPAPETSLSSTPDASTIEVAPPTTSETVSLPVRDGWHVVFADTFSGDSLDEAWNTCHWWQVDGGCTIASNDEQQWYRPEGVSVGEGDLRLRATPDPQLTTDGGVLPYRSGMVTTGPADTDDDSSSFEFTYGEVSARAMVPGGGGTWPAIWLLSSDKTSLPEIDVFEWYGNRPELMTSHVHARIDGERASARVESAVTDFAGVWHTFTMTWLPDRVVFAVDGVETGRITDPELIPHTPMYLVANLAMGGEAGPVSADSFPQTFRIDEIVVTRPEES